MATKGGGFGILQNNFKKIVKNGAEDYSGGNPSEESAMFQQNPVFIPGPTNMPEVLRKAVDMPTLDHRSPLFAKILHPALAGVKRVVKSETAKIFVFPSTGTGGWETALTNTLSPGSDLFPCTRTEPGVESQIVVRGGPWVWGPLLERCLTPGQTQLLVLQCVEAPATTTP